MYSWKANTYTLQTPQRLLKAPVVKSSLILLTIYARYKRRCHPRPFCEEGNVGVCLLSVKACENWLEKPFFQRYPTALRLTVRGGGNSQNNVQQCIGKPNKPG